MIPVISCRRNRDRDSWKMRSEDMFFQGELSFNDEVYITNARHKAALEEALESLKLVKEQY